MNYRDVELLNGSLDNLSRTLLLCAKGGVAAADELLDVATTLAAGPKVTLVVSPQAPALEQTAASELSDLLLRMYDAEVTTAGTKLLPYPQ